MTFTDEEYSQMACLSIKNYLKVDDDLEEIKEKYPLAVKKLIKNSIGIDKLKPVAGIKSMNQGSRSVTFDDNVESLVITEDIKMLLPKPHFYAW
ncbi:hypothetical protein NNC19_07210 [Clostridium sp. SHJSY1]|uniref:hypothetical protein n=1 Tax=Clostridium sp. SHJSY1 TaxID=2942483 RepID=UPI002875895F|nr:hypothetical protein [Clostridium sp. SHJSY1]MDS0525462.1 hypothetical protein [Clostridium sp. SHJSY1]